MVALTCFLGVSTPSQEPAEPEVSTQETPFTLKVQRNEVPVRVVVRDTEGKPVRNLTKEDFQILDEGKPQEITQFSVESAGAAPAANPGAKGTAAETSAPAKKIADRFVALYFDDLVMDYEQIVHVREAAEKVLQTAFQPADRVAIYTSSGRSNLDFTSDREKLREALSRLNTSTGHARTSAPCPQISDYEAYQIAENSNRDTLQIVAGRAAACLCPAGNVCPDTLPIAQNAANVRWAQLQLEIASELRGLDTLVRRMSYLPGQRTVVFVSPGFLSGSQLQKISEIVDRAVRAGVIVNALDPRGLYVKSSVDANGLVESGRYRGEQEVHVELVVGSIADATGGVFFQNSNDFDLGFRTVGGLAEYSYLMAFSPGDLKPNGKYHRLKVNLVGSARARGYTVQTRRGYFASVTEAGSDRLKEQAMNDELYSRNEVNRTMIQLGTRFFKPTPEEARVTVTARFDPQGLTFRKEDDRQVNNLTFATVIFDQDGNFIQGLEKTLYLRLRDVTLERMRARGIAVASDFKIPPGTYMVREVIRDNSGLVSSTNSTLEIPY